MTAFRPGDRVHLKHHARTRATTGTVVNAERFAGGHVFVRWDDNQAVTSHLPQHLEPAGEPMSTAPDFFAEPGSHNPEPKTFESAQGHGRTLEVERVSGQVNLVIRKGPSRPKSYIGISLNPDDAPAFALAILEAAGLENVPHDSANGAEKALGYLIEYVGLQRANAKAAADREKLEGEALVLLNAAREADELPHKGSFEECRPGTKDRFIAVARAARTFRGAKA